MDDILGNMYKIYVKVDEDSCKDGIGGCLINFVYELK